tara:strand:+ start:186 stop:1250 length:1065 start_codon:yes stop_codon:yes gene_type:complete
MLAIPIPFVVAMLFALIAVTLYLRHSQHAKTACGFLLLCCITTSTVGLRWSLPLPIFHYLQPILASMIPVAAWLTFAHATTNRYSKMHVIAPFIIALTLLVQAQIALPVDLILTLIYVIYGGALIRQACRSKVMVNVSLGHWESVKRSQLIAGFSLLLSAAVDAAISIDFAINQGAYATYILTIAHLILLPILSVAVITTAINTTTEPADSALELPTGKTLDKSAETKIEDNSLSKQKAHEIVQALDDNMRLKSSYLDPELTLSKLSRKLGYPAKQISMAVNQIHQRNISKLINEYRIKHAQQALTETKDSVTQISLNCGFQSKSNFNREFSRVSGMTPTQYRTLQLGNGLTNT